LLLKQVGHSHAEGARIHAETFGRVSKLLPFISGSVQALAMDFTDKHR
jgi:hypothetical protein